MKKRKITAFIIVTLAITIMAISTFEPVQAQPKFTLATWSYPDTYGQGIEGIQVYENSTGVFAEVDGSPVLYDDPASETVFGWDAGVGIRFDVWANLNSTLVGVEDRTEGRLYIRHYALVQDSDSDTVFSQQNFTYYYSSEDNFPLYLYVYRITLGFLPVSGETYTITIMCEIYY